MKKVFLLVLVLIVSASLWAGGSGEKAAYPTSDKPIYLKGGLVSPPGSLQTLTCERWAELVKQETNGAVVIEVYPAEQLGNERALMENMNIGTVDWSYIGPGGAVQFNPAFGMFENAYTFQSAEHVKKVSFSPEFITHLDELLSAKSNLNYLGLGWVGSRHVITDKPILSPSDAQGLKLRHPDVPTYKIAARAMGFTPNPMPYGEVYMALSQGVIDAAECPFANIVDMKWYEVKKVITMTSHVEGVIALFMNKNSMAKLSPDQQKIVRDSAQKALKEFFQKALDKTADYKKVLENAGVKIVDLTSAQKAVFIKRAQDMLAEEYIPKWGKTWELFSSYAK